MQPETKRRVKLVWRSVRQTGLGPSGLLVRLDCGHLVLPRAPFTAVIPCLQCKEASRGA